MTYGPRQNGLGEAGVVAIFIEKFLAGHQAVINGDGLQTRDFVYVADLVAVNLLALNYPSAGVFNIGTGQETDFRTIAGKLQEPHRLLHQPDARPSQGGGTTPQRLEQPDSRG